MIFVELEVFKGDMVGENRAQLSKDRLGGYFPLLRKTAGDIPYIRGLIEGR